MKKYFVFLGISVIGLSGPALRAEGFPLPHPERLPFPVKSDELSALESGLKKLPGQILFAPLPLHPTDPDLPLNNREMGSIFTAGIGLYFAGYFSFSLQYDAYRGRNDYLVGYEHMIPRFFLVLTRYSPRSRDDAFENLLYSGISFRF